jgi:ABC-type phosphate transport system substrate-binding protein
MKRRTVIAWILLAALGATAPRAWSDEGLVVIGNLPVRNLDAETLKRVYTGRTIELEGLPLRPLNLPSGHPLRRRFLAGVLQQQEDDYVAYWTVRRYIGKGVPPRELPATADVISHVRDTPGAIGYIDAAQLTPDLNVLLRR